MPYDASEETSWVPRLSFSLVLVVKKWSTNIGLSIIGQQSMCQCYVYTVSGFRHEPMEYHISTNVIIAISVKKKGGGAKLTKYRSSVPLYQFSIMLKTVGFSPLEWNPANTCTFLTALLEQPNRVHNCRNSEWWYCWNYKLLINREIFNRHYYIHVKHAYHFFKTNMVCVYKSIFVARNCWAEVYQWLTFKFLDPCVRWIPSVSVQWMPLAAKLYWIPTNFSFEFMCYDLENELCFLFLWFVSYGWVCMP